jgi:hypothetical protein
LSFDLCKNKKSAYSCKDKKDGIILLDGAKECTQFTGGWNEDKTWKFFTVNEYESSIGLDFPEGEICDAAKGTRYQVSVKLNCQISTLFEEHAKVLNDGTFNEKACKNQIIIETIDACPKFYYYSMWNAVILNKYILSLIFVAAGILLVLFGKPIFDYILIILTAFTGAVIVRGLLLPYYELNTYFCIAIGIGFGVLVWFCRQLSNIALAITFGYALGSANFVFVFAIFPNVNPYFLFYAFVILTILLCWLIIYYIDTLVKVLVSSILGSYCFVRGLSFLLGGFPDEFYAIKLIEKAEVGQLRQIITGKVLIYLISIVLLVIVGVIIQTKYFVHEDPPATATKSAGDADESEKLKNKETGGASADAPPVAK